MEKKHRPFSPLMRALVHIALAAFCIQLLPLYAMAQTAPESLLSRFAARRANALKVSFSYNPRYPAEGQAVQFTDASSGSPTSWQWDFGDGLTGTDQNPVHIYMKSGFYRITLIATNSSGSKRANRTITIVPAAATASFVYSPSSPKVGQIIQFADTSSGSPTSWQWNFGDGATSTVKNPSHAYSAPGAFVVSLIVSNSSSSRTTSHTVSVLPESALSASFTYSSASPAAGQSVQFTDTSAGSPTSWSWSFGDGTTSTTQNPSHVYTTTGSKTVTLSVSNASGSNSTSRTITVVAALSASFAHSPTSPVAGQPVQFTDTSAGSPTSWAWNFNDGTTSSTRNPSHVFNTAGAFNVTLTVINASGQDDFSQIITVAPVSPLMASFAYSPAAPVAGQPVQFTDTSTGGPTSWAWSFGDGGTGTSQNPIHTYQATGAFAVTLAVSKDSDSNSASRMVNVIPEAAGYCVDTNNPGASDSNPGTEALPWKTISKANQTLVAGDTVYIKSGNYTDQIAPVNSGTASGRISYRAYGSDVVTVRDTTAAITLSGKSYITVQGINFYNCDRFMHLSGATHNIIAYCRFDQVRNRSDWAGSSLSGNSQYNWIHHCQFSKYGQVLEGDDRGSVLDIGAESSTTDLTRYNLIEDCTLFHGGHHVLGVFSMYNVYRRNYIHNEEWMTGAGDRGTTTYGNRNVYFSGYAVNAGRNLFEDNRVGYSADPPDQDGVTSVLVITSHNIIRRNEIFNSDRSGLAMGLTSTYPNDITYNKIYNNTFFHSGVHGDSVVDNSAIFLVIYGGTHVIENNAIKNNLLYKHIAPYGAYGYADLGDQIFAGNWDGDTQGDPLFVNASLVLPDPMDPDLPDLHLNSGSPCISAGTYLTTITSASGSGTTLTVADAGYFTDGWGIEGVAGDEIQIVGTSQKARIVSVNYTNNTITLATTLTWTQGQGLVLAYVGSAPDIGAHEFVSALAIR
jgi:PKD repeat protein